MARVEQPTEAIEDEITDPIQDATSAGLMVGPLVGRAELDRLGVAHAQQRDRGTQAEGQNQILHPVAIDILHL